MKRRRSQRVEVACPHCAHAQWESGAAVSTFCRGCGDHYEIARGRAISKGARSRSGNYLRLASDDLWSGRALLGFAADRGTTENGRAPENGSSQTDRSQNGEPARELRSVACFECGREEEVSAASTSANCPGCGAYISLRNVHVRNDSRQKIKTRGDVTIHRNASLQGSSLSCRNLKVMGSVSGSVECSGTASFYSDCEVRGVFSCKLLRVRNNVKVHFEHAVNAHNVEIAGDATGHLYCSGDVRVESGGVLLGEVIARTIDVIDGGYLDAGLRICSQESPSASIERPAVEPAEEPAPAETTEEEPSFWRRRKASPAST